MTNPQEKMAAEKFTGGKVLELVAYQAGTRISRINIPLEYQ
jgi:hypothetical protein